MGFETALEFLRGYWETFDDFWTEIDAAEVMNYYFQVLTFRDDKIARLSIHTDKAEALEAVGLSE